MDKPALAVALEMDIRITPMVVFHKGLYNNISLTCRFLSTDINREAVILC